MKRVNLIAPDGLSREYWDFDLAGGGSQFVATLKAYGIERRDRPKGRFRKATPADRWTTFDERSYFSGIERPMTIPKDIMWKLMTEASCIFCIGWGTPERNIETVPFYEIAQRT